jgi:hypothetical protein
MNILTCRGNQPSILNNIELTEHIDINILNCLIYSDLLQLTKSNKFGNFENEKQQLLEIQKRIKNSKLKVQYRKAKYNYGRVFPVKSLSLGCLRKPIRHTLCNGTYTDLDIENCHPKLLIQYCLANDIQVKYLLQYVENRTKILLETQEYYYDVNRDDAKKLFIILAYLLWLF